MTGTLFVRPDGTSCGASMVKMSVDCPSEAPRCQRILSITPQISFEPEEIADAISGLFFGAGLCGKKLFAPPLADPGAPTVIAKWTKSTRRDKCINLCPNRGCFRRAEVVIDYEPASVSQQVTVAIQIPADVI